MKKNIKTIIGLIIAIIIGISTTVTAATIFRSEDITYSSNKTDKTNVKDSLDELYSKVGKCPEGQYCYTEPLGISDKVELGSYISMAPTSTSYTISKDLTGYTSDQKINPSELNLWRVIRKNVDGTIDVVSEYMSSTDVWFYGKIGFLNYVGTLNVIAAQYTNEKYVQSTRNIGYGNQAEYCTTLEECTSDLGYEADINLVRTALQTIGSASPNGEQLYYWLSSRKIKSSNYSGLEIDSSGEIKSSAYLLTSSQEENRARGRMRPILTLKSNIEIKSGDGKSAETAYQLN